MNKIPSKLILVDPKDDAACDAAVDELLSDIEKDKAAKPDKTKPGAAQSDSPAPRR